jgi:Ser/Thr protein kinase RdoA (MazF antagonist)
LASAAGTGQNPDVARPVLSAAETQAVSALLARAWGPGCEIRAATAIWKRRHVFRLQVTTDRSVVLKRRGDQDGSFGVELAALEYLNAMPVPVAPRLVAADAQAGLLLMEDLGPGPSLADALLAGDRERARADLVSYAEALGAMHAWSMGRAGELAGLRARYAPQVPLSPAWLGAVGRGREAFGEAVAALGLAVDGVGAEIDEILFLLNGPGYLGLVHGDACPDNMRFRADGCRLFDFETSGWGPVVLDAAYLLAPFPSCWCFARLPAEVAAAALDAYRAVVQAAGLELSPDWDAAMAAAVAAWIVARGPMINRVLVQGEDREWGTTTLRPRLAAWLGSFTEAAGRAGVLPRLRDAAGALLERLGSRWPQTAVPDYPALAGPGSARVVVPEWWQPGL